MSASEDIRLKIACDAYSSVFNSGPYTTFNMMNFLLQRQRITWEDYLKNPDILISNARAELTVINNNHVPTKVAVRDYMIKEVTQDRKPTDKKITKASTTNQFATTWNLKTGRCTSFALAVVDFMERMSPTADYWDFNFYSLNDHRVARCKKSGMLIDSSSARGPLILKDNSEWKTIDGDAQSWKYDNGMSKFRRDQNTQPAQSSITIDRNECMAVCLIGVVDKDILCFFRSFSENTARYHAILKWKPRNKRFELNYRKEDGVIEQVIFQWEDTAGTKIEEAELFGAIVIDFIDKYGGPHGHMQWNSGSIHTINFDIYEGAVKAWGKPNVVGADDFIKSREANKPLKGNL